MVGIRVALLLSLYCVAATNNGVVTRSDVVDDVVDTICRLGLFEKVSRYFEFCAEDGVSKRMCANSRFHFVYSSGIVNLSCPVSCPNQSASDVLWSIHLMSANYSLTVYCYNNGTCVNNNQLTTLLDITGDFTIVNNRLNFYYDVIYEDAYIGCVVSTNDCLKTQYYIIDGEYARSFLAPEVRIAVSTREFYVALGDQLTIPCEGIGSFRATVAWYYSQEWINEFIPGCGNETETYCLGHTTNEYKQLRVRALYYKKVLCTIEFATLFNRLEIVMANWTDSGSLYRCTAIAWHSSSNGEKATEEAHPIIHVDVIPKFVELPPVTNISSFTGHDTYSCVVMAGWQARIRWYANTTVSEDDNSIPEHSLDDTDLPSMFVTYSIHNSSTTLDTADTSYTGGPLHTVKPIHNATLHITNIPSYARNMNFACKITGVNRNFLAQYNISEDSLVHTMQQLMPAAPVSSSSASSNSTLFVAIGLVISLLIAIVVVLVIIMYYRRYRHLKKTSSLMPATFGQLTVNIPMDLKFINENKEVEFPRDKVTLLHVLGEGHFGKVWMAKAEGIVQNIPHLNIVAVKTCKDAATKCAVNDLWSELEILLKIKPHPNVCNLLGFCYSEGESPHIILEYCMYGKLNDYLRSCQDVLVQLGLPIKSVNLHNASNFVRKSSNSTDYVNILQSNSSSSTYLNLHQVLTRDNSLLSEQSDSVFSDNVAYVPESMDSYQKPYTPASEIVSLSRDYVSSPGLLVNEDIVNFALQIAYGLQHLEKLKIYHGDISARNILIAEGFLLKIADFGMARELGKEEYYMRKSDRPLPVKWMAIESLKESKCTHKSDMWSYGVVLWEIITYGESPYKGVPNGDMLSYLQKGERLPQPNGCTDTWYNLMRLYWSDNTSERPSATNTIERLSKPPFVIHESAV